MLGRIGWKPCLDDIKVSIWHWNVELAEIDVHHMALWYLMTTSKLIVKWEDFHGLNIYN